MVYRTNDNFIEIIKNNEIYYYSLLHLKKSIVDFICFLHDFCQTQLSKSHFIYNNISKHDIFFTFI